MATKTLFLFIILGIFFAGAILTLPPFLEVSAPVYESEPVANNTNNINNNNYSMQQNKDNQSSYNAEFSERYPNPIFAKDVETKIKGLRYLSVWDKSMEVEDPITMSGWISNEKGDKFPAHQEGVLAALNSVNFNPQTDEQAMEVAAIQWLYSNDNFVFVQKPFPPYIEAPQDAIDKIELPKIKKIGDNYEVTFYVYSNSFNSRWFGKDIRSISKYTFLVGQGVYEMQSQETIWGTPDSLPETSLPF